MNSSTPVIDAARLLDIGKSIVDNAEILAQQIALALNESPCAIVRMAGVRGASPSYYSTVLKRLGDRFGFEKSLDRVRFEFDSSAQEHAFTQSVNALRKLAASEPSR
jgi:hypothetical protein